VDATDGDPAPDPARVYGAGVPWAVYHSAGWTARAWTRSGGWPGIARYAARVVVREAVRAAVRHAVTSRRRAAPAGRGGQSRRRVDTLRRLRRMDSPTRGVAWLYGCQAREASATGTRVRSVLVHRRYGSGFPTPPVDVHPGWAVRRARLIRAILRGVARGSVRPTAVPDAWAVAAAVADGVTASPCTEERHGRAVPDRYRRK
jgi:hypothetical protein